MGTKSWDQGVYVLSNVSAGTSCNNNVVGADISSNGCVTAGTGGVIRSNSATLQGLSNASSSVCPKGWRLPSSGGVQSQRSFNQDGSWGNMLAKYGWTGTSSVSGVIDVKMLISEPIFLMRSGHVSSDGYIWASGYQAFYSSATAYTDTSYFYDFSFSNNTEVYPSGEGRRFQGYSVRCLAR